MAELELVAPPEEEVEEDAPEVTELSESAKAAAVEMVKQCLREEQWARRQEVRDARRQRFYERGDQYIYWSEKDYTFAPAAESGEALPAYTNVYNIFRPYMRSLTSVLSQNPPGNDFVPDDLSKPTDISASKAAEKMRHRIDREVDMKKVQNDISRMFCTDSRVIVRCWSDEEGSHADVGGTLEWKVPIYTKGMKYWGYAVNSAEFPIDYLQELYPDIAEEIIPTQNSAEASYERIARMGVLSGSRGLYNADNDRHLVTRHIAWIRPRRYRKLPDAVKDEFKELYPEGVRITLCGNTFAEAVAEPMESVLANGHPSSGDGQNHASLMKDCVSLQDDFNDGMNQAREFFDYGIPTTWFDETAVDAESIPEQDSAPATYHPAKAANGMALSDAFFQEAPAVLPSGLVDWLTNISTTLAQFITGAVPALWGGGTIDAQTLGGQQMDRDQAMGGMSTPWSSMQGLMAKVTELCVKSAAGNYSGKTLAIPSQSAPGAFETFDVDDIADGNWGCHPDTDSSFPETTAAKRAAFQSFATLVSQTPEGAMILSQPDNQKLALEYSGLEDFDIPGAEARDKQLREIQKLLQEQPINPTPQEIAQWQQQTTIAQEQGLEIPPQPMPQTSVPVDDDWDYHDEEAKKVQQWLSSEDRVTQERSGNVLGIENVRLHGMAHRAALAKQQQAMQAIPQKPISISASLKDLPPAAQAAKLQESGLPATQDTVVEHDAEQKTAKVLEKAL